MGGSKDEGLLDSLRVLDVTNEKGYLCGRMLADLGADVIKIERPGGDLGRRLGPFYHDIPDPEKSLYWFAYNANKRGVTLDIETTDGSELFKRLVMTADVIVESFPLGYMDKLGLGYEALSQINRGIIFTAISPFGQSGPYSSFKDSDIVLMSMGGYVYACGEPERAPLRIGFPQAYLFAGADAAAGTMIAYYHREITGEGQYVDVSAQDSIFWTAGPLTHWTLNRTILKREGQSRGGLSAKAKQRLIWPCKDGFIAFQIYGTQMGRKTNRNIVQWMDSEGMANDLLRGMDWATFDMSTVTQDFMDKIEEPIGRFFLLHPKAELEAEAVKRDIVLYLVSNMGDLPASPQLKARNYWVEVEHPELNASITYPGAWANISDYGWRMRFRAPLIGEHNEEIYCRELGLSKNELIAMKEAGII